MAKLLDLPPELLLTIASFLWSNQPLKKRLFEASIDKKRQSLVRSLHRERSSVINLSSACKALHETLKTEKYRFVSIHGHNSAHKLLSLLRLIRIRPEIGDHIHQLHLRLLPFASGLTSVSYEQLRSLRTWAETIGVRVNDVLLTALNYEDHKDSINYEDLYGHEKTCLRILCAMMCYYLRHVKDISLSMSLELFSTFADQLISRRPPPWNQRSTNLPTIRSLALETSNPEMLGVECMNPWDAIRMAEVAKSVSEIYLRGFGLRFTAEMTYSNHFLHSLVLQDVFLPPDGSSSVYRFLESCKSLARFIYLRTNNISEYFEYSQPRPVRMQKALTGSRNSLQTLCIYCGPKIRDDGTARFLGTFERFPCLESLWVDAWSCGWAVGDDVETDVEIESESNFVEEEPTPALATRLIQTLPPSLRRLHIDGPVDRIYDSLRWFANHCRDGMVPRFKELAFEDLDSRIATENLRSMFREAGVKHCKVDKDIVMW
ncbi:hypothetical protein CGRA01v4_14305 [Colletotrichum graminicola]|uniref:A to I editase domain-containing protein n=1 Tax=Colletotrichum graminicola (strain M1.001 / M2 / FGSC 10212) TaxID=645133 RepID=E3Q5D3_COLGM|nr:uncharacterized protein GLRG_01044 [Colletotrichum graminicola M1.001]EFQ25900.1 hypothetical protein GLRG_01044 [Colletotrichum graminicola M1.001]WDK23014.1 hypothetical protein CGRA01v4_14305 [Colletotrichum graminicola]